MLVNADPYGATYEFSFGDSDAPVIDNFVPVKLELEFAEELKVSARDAKGVIRAMVVSHPAARKITAAVTGYIIAGFSPDDLSSGFTFESRFYIITNISNPRMAGDFKYLTLTAESHPGITDFAFSIS